MRRWLPLVALAIAQFVMVLDQSVMNVSITQLVSDFDTSVTTIQAVITLYCLVMAMLMLTGGKIGEDFECFKAPGCGFADMTVEIGLGGVELHGDLRPTPGGHSLKIGSQRGAVDGYADESASGGGINGLNFYTAEIG